MELLSKIESWVIRNLEHIGIGDQYSSYGYIAMGFLVILFIGWVANLIVKKFIVEILRSGAKRTNTKLGEYLLQESFFLRLSHLAPAFIISTLFLFLVAEYACRITSRISEISCSSVFPCSLNKTASAEQAMAELIAK